MAPEVLRCTDRDCPALAYGPAADIWALGSMLHELLLGKTPFNHCDALVTIKVGPLVTGLTSLSLLSHDFEFHATGLLQMLHCALRF